MASSINASTTAGVVTTADTSGVLNIQTAGTTAISIDASQAVSLTSGLAVTGALSATGTGTLRDLITTTGALIQGTSIFRVESTAAALPAGTLAGLGLEMYASSGTQKLSVYNRTTNLAGPLDLLGSTFNFNAILDISNASAGQIKFPATQNASSNANTLDDYEEGTFDPTITRLSTNPTVTYTTQLGSYVKVGRLVSVTLGISWSANSGGSGVFTISGLPFTNTNSADNYSQAFAADMSGVTFPVGTTTIGGYVNINSTTIFLTCAGSGVVSAGPTLGSSGYLYMSVTYMASA